MLKRGIGVILCSIAFFVSTSTQQALAKPTIDGKAVVCDTFDKYGVNVQSVRWIGDYIIDNLQETPRGAVTIMQTSISLYCPNYNQAFNDLNNQLAKDQHPGNPLYK